MNVLKQVLAIPVASRGLTHYWKGRTNEALKWLKRSYSWDPDVIEGTIFEAYPGFSLLENGEKEIGKKPLVSAKQGLEKITSLDTEINLHEKEALEKINEILNNNDT